jgi:VanZ family protein
MRRFALIMIGVIALITLLADLGYADHVFRLLSHVPGGDLTGHFGLYGFLSFGVTSWLALPSVSATRGRHIPVTVALAVVVTLEELSQAFIAVRTFSLRDLSASLAGVLVGSLASMWLAGSRRRPTRR